MSQPVTFTAAIGAKYWRIGLEAALADNPSVRFDFQTVSPIHRAFAPMAREQVYDASEMAIVTALQAFAYNKPIIVLPVTLAARFQHKCLVGLRGRAPADASGLKGGTIAVRAYTQTTGVWVRGLLAEEAGVAPGDVTWLTQEGAHVAEYEDPAWVKHVDPKLSLMDLLHSGQAQAAIFGNDLPDDPDLVSMFPDPKAADAAWYARHGTISVNHLLTIRRDVAEKNPDAVRALWQVLKALHPTGGDIDMAPSGITALTAPVNFLLEACAAQKLLPRAFSVTDLFAEAKSLLGEAA